MCHPDQIKIQLDIDADSLPISINELFSLEFFYNVT